MARPQCGVTPTLRESAIDEQAKRFSCDDPTLAQMLLSVDDYTWITERILDLADKHARGRVVSSLEGGYALDALAASACAHVRTLARL